jgi:hypothetical protein
MEQAPELAGVLVRGDDVSELQARQMIMKW